MTNHAQEALGLIETRGLVAAIEAADAALKSATVRLLGMEQTQAALITISFSGETAAVQSAVDAGAAAAEKIGQLVSRHVIPRPAHGTSALLNSDASPATSASPELESMTVRELRAYARTQDGLSIQGREIARANKEQLLKALGSISR